VSIKPMAQKISAAKNSAAKNLAAKNLAGGVLHRPPGSTTANWKLS
jgi:hypothetical protein